MVHSNAPLHTVSEASNSSQPSVQHAASHDAALPSASNSAHHDAAASDEEPWLRQPQLDDPASQQRLSPHTAITASLRAHTARLRMARIRAEFEHTLLVILAMNVIYTYYIDHKLLVLIIRVSQVIRLLYYLYDTESVQRSTAVLLLLSNLPVILIHRVIFTGPNISRNIGEMLFINFLAPEPKSLIKVLYVDVVVMVLQAILLQCKWELTNIRILPALPVSLDESLLSSSSDNLSDEDNNVDHAHTPERSTR